LRDGAFLITSVNVAPRLAAAASASDVFAFGQLLGYILLKFARKSCIWGIVQRVHTGFIEVPRQHGQWIAIQFAVFAVIVGLAYVLIVRPLLKLAARPPQKLEQRDSTPAGGGTDLDSLMSALQNQALELRGKHASAVSSLSLDFDVLNNRLSTIGSRLNKAMEAAAKSEASVAVLTTSNDDYRRRLSEAEGELALLRPLTAKLEHELRLARNQITETDRRLVTLETDYAASQGTCNELLQKMSSSDLARQRTMEENAALAQKLNEREFAVQSLLREAAHLKSESASITGNLELAERDARLLADKYTVELEGNSRSSSALNAL
jgi:hypothetical protein